MEVKIASLEQRLRKLEKRVPKTFDIFYKPPGGQSHQKLHLSLDELYGKINRIEERLSEQ